MKNHAHLAHTIQIKTLVLACIVTILACLMLVSIIPQGGGGYPFVHAAASDCPAPSVVTLTSPGTGNLKVTFSEPATNTGASPIHDGKPRVYKFEYKLTTADSVPASDPVTASATDPYSGWAWLHEFGETEDPNTPDSRSHPVTGIARSGEYHVRYRTSCGSSRNNPSVSSSWTTSEAVQVEGIAPSFGDTGIDNIEVVQLTNFTPVVLPEATGGSGTLTYTLTQAQEESDPPRPPGGHNPPRPPGGFNPPGFPGSSSTELPQGLRFNSQDRTLRSSEGSGLLHGAAKTYNLVYTVTDGNSSEDTIEFTLTIVKTECPLPKNIQISSPGIKKLRIVFTEPITITHNSRTYTPTNYKFGNVRTFSDSVPGTSEAVSHTISDFADKGRQYVQIHTTCSLVEGSSAPIDNRSRSSTKWVTVKGFDETIDDMTLPPNHAITLPVLPQATGDDGTLTYTLTATTTDGTLSGNLPTGLSFNASTRVLSGTPTTEGTYAMTYTVSDTDNGTDTVSFTITIVYEPPELNTVSDRSFKEDTAITDTTLPEATKGAGTLTYTLTATTTDGTLSGSLPAGLSFNTTTRVLSGTPTAEGTYAMTYTATDSVGSTSKSFTITVSDPTFVQRISNMALEKDAAITGVTLPEAEDDGTTPSYTLTATTTDGTLSGSLPAGLSFNTATRVLSGTPTAEGTYAMTYSARGSSNKIGTTSFTIAVHGTFSINLEVVPAGSTLAREKKVLVTFPGIPAWAAPDITNTVQGTVSSTGSCTVSNNQINVNYPVTNENGTLTGTISLNHEGFNNKYICVKATYRGSSTVTKVSSEVISGIVQTAGTITIIESSEEVAAKEKVITAIMIPRLGVTTAENRYMIQPTATCDETTRVASEGTRYTSGGTILLDSESYNDQYVCFSTKDSIGNVGYAVSSQITGIERTPPRAITISAVSNNQNTGRAKVGDKITLTFTVDDANPGDEPTVTLFGRYMAVSGTSPAYTAVLAVRQDDEDESQVATITMTDTATNSGTTTHSILSDVTVDTKPPVITLHGDASITITQGSTYTDLGATAHDSQDGSVDVSVSGTVNTAVAGTYTVSYAAQDAAGNRATSATRIVEVGEDTTPPTITIIGDNPLYISIGSEYVDPGATAIDATDGSVSVTALANKNPHTQSEHVFIVTYTAVDSNNNTATATREVRVVVDALPPVVTLNPPNPLYMSVDGEEIFTHTATLDSDTAGFTLSEEDVFGSSAATAGTTLAVGVPGDNTGGANRGAVYLFTKNTNTGTWTYTSRLNSNTSGFTLANGDNFGASVALSGSILVVGAPNGQELDGTNSGVVYLFKNIGGTWTYVNRIDDDNSAPGTQVNIALKSGDGFGASVALNSTKLFIGFELRRPVAGETDTGGTSTVLNNFVAYDVDASDGSVTKTPGFFAAPIPGDVTMHDYFGSALALSADGNTIVVGAKSDGGVNGNSGKVHIYTKNDTGYSKETTIDTSTLPSHTEASYFGQSVAISGDTLIISAARDAAEGYGSVHVFNKSGNQWVYKKTFNDFDMFGASVALSSDTLVVGSSEDAAKGAVNVFYRSTGPVPFDSIDPGATAVDNRDGKMQPEVSHTVDHTTSGTYTVTYSATDRANFTTTKTRQVVVLASGADNPPADDPRPKLSFNSSFTGIGLTNDLTPSITINSTEPGTITHRGCKSNLTEITSAHAVVGGGYKVTLSMNTLQDGTYYGCGITVTDTEGNISLLLKIPPFIIDTIPPVITLNRGSSILTPLNNSFSDPGATATDNAGRTVDISVSGTVNTAVEGSYTLTYTAQDAAGNSVTKNRIVTVIEDTVPPVITLNGDSEVRVTRGNEFNDPGAAATDDVDGTVEVLVSGEVDTSETGTYTLIYTASDRAGNKAKSKTRKVLVKKRSGGGGGRPGRVGITAPFFDSFLLGGSGENQQQSSLTQAPILQLQTPQIPQTTYYFTRDLTLTSTGEDVRQLQIFLNASGYTVANTGAGSPGSETTYFGTLTRAALARYQAANGISPAVGYFGPITRAHINTTQTISNTTQTVNVSDNSTMAPQW